MRKADQKVVFICEKCGKEQTIRFANYNCNICSLCKRKKTSMERYGVENPGQSEQAIQKQKQILIDKYGSVEEGYKHHQEKRRKTLLEKYGVDNNAKREDVKEKTKQTLIDKHGSVKEAYIERKKRIQEAMLEKYGVTTNLVFVKFKKYAYDDNFFDSSWELAYYIWLKDNNISFKYHTERILYIGDDGKEHYYYPDFIVDGKIVEIKGDHFFNEKGEPYDKYHKVFWKNKYDLIISSGGRILLYEDMKEIINYVSDKYGKNFLKSCKL